jgi:hypothetical protein
MDSDSNEEEQFQEINADETIGGPLGFITSKSMRTGMREI